MSSWRLLDTGRRSAAENMAIDEVLLRGMSEGTSPPTLRFLRFSPPAVLVGAFQRVEDEVREDFCSERSIDVNRRLTGGGAIFFDRTQLGWEIVCRWRDMGASRPSGELFERLCRPLVQALGDLGMDAAWRPRNDIEVGGRKISGTGGTDLGGAMLFQGTLLVDFDAQTMVRALRVPVEKLRRREIENLIDRVTWMSREVGEPPPLSRIMERIAKRFSEMTGAEPVPAGLTPGEEASLDEVLPRFRSRDWVYGRGRRSTELVRALYSTPGGMLKPVLRCDTGRRRIESLILDGDFFAYPRRGVFDLEAALKGAQVRDVPSIVRDAFDRGRIDIPGASADHVIAAISEALDRGKAGSLGLTARQANSTFVVGGALGHIAGLGPTHLLLPYCAKPVECENRGRDSCERCGECGVGPSYEMGEEAGLEVHTVTSYDNLMDTLHDLKHAGVPAYIGSCCEAFYVKHRRDLESVGLPGILIDVAGSESCFDLGKSAFAYRGQYEGRSEMDVDLLGALLSACEVTR